jgi:hypothetical protein
MNALPDLWQHHKTLPPQDRQAFLEQHIHPLLFSSLTPTVFPAPNLSIHTLGTSIEPVVIAAKKIGAPQVLLLGTAETLPLLGKIAPHCPNQTICALEIERAGTQSIYQAVRQAATPYTHLALEITSGTKAMVAALSMMALKLKLEGCHVALFYVDNPNWDSEARRPVPGHEQLIRLDLP